MDSWEAHDYAAVHTTLADWDDAVLVHPCSLNYLGRWRPDSPLPLPTQASPDVR
ncbi:hypothetical protein GCM10027425_25030 [Alteromonas gracilis]